MKQLRIVQGGIENGDKALVERLAGKGGTVRRWVIPKSAQPGDDVVIYIAGYGFFATAMVTTPARPRDDWPNRYGAALDSFRLIEPAISLGAIRRHVPELTWGVYPRSITTPAADVAKKIRALIRHRRKTGLPDIDEVNRKIKIPGTLSAAQKGPVKASPGCMSGEASDGRVHCESSGRALPRILSM